MRPYTLIPLREGPLDIHGGGEGPAGAGKGNHEAVAHGLDLVAAVAGELLAQDAVVLGEEGMVGLVAQALGQSR